MNRDLKNAALCLLLAAILLPVTVYFFLSRQPIMQTPFSGTASPLAGPADIYPRVPGAVNADIVQGNIGQNICNKNWSTSSERPSSNYTTALKIKQLVELGLKDTRTGDYEEDHLISLELGGNPTDPNNLWPEPYTASIANGGAKKKDLVENFLHAQICAGTITLVNAQKEIATDWYKVYVTELAGKYGSVNAYIDPDDN